jgi:hypothetical protein
LRLHTPEPGPGTITGGRMARRVSSPSPSATAGPMCSWAGGHQRFRPRVPGRGSAVRSKRARRRGRPHRERPARKWTAWPRVSQPVPSTRSRARMPDPDLHDVPGPARRRGHHAARGANLPAQRVGNRRAPLDSSAPAQPVARHPGLAEAWPDLESAVVPS